jgi:hypothetical protein
MERFDRAVLYWSRLREFAADEAGTRITSADASGRALLRTGAVEARINEVLAETFRHPESAPVDLIAATIDHAREQGLDDPSGFHEAPHAHPTDTHPPTHQRLAALGVTLTPALLAEVMAPPAAEALVRTSALFAAPEQLYRDLTDDFVGDARDAHRAHRESLEVAASAVGDDALVISDGGGGWGWVMFIGGLFFALMGIGIKWQEPQFPEGANIMAGGCALAALVIFYFSVKMLTRGQKPFVTLRPDTITLDGVDRPLAWSEIEEVGYYVVGPATKTKGLGFSVFLKPEAPLPGRAKGQRRAIIRRKKRKIEVTSMRFRDLTAQGFADLIHQYRVADGARRVIEQQDAAAAAAAGAGRSEGSAQPLL